MKLIKSLSWVVSGMFLCSSVLIAQEVKKDEKLKKEVKKQEVVDITVAGAVEKKSKGEGKSFYVVKNSEGKLVALIGKVGGQEVDFEQYVGKMVIVKGKGYVLVKTNKDGKEDGKSIRFSEISTIEITGAAPKEEEKKPEDKKTEEKKPEEAK